MARISKHGTVIGTVELVRCSKKYMSDGTVLVNQGFGWKLGGKLKPELQHLTPQELYQRAVEHKAAWAKKHPTAAAFSKLLIEVAGLKRWKLRMAIEMMPDDPDGCWSEACDGYGDNVHAGLDDIVELCRLYKGALDEAKMLGKAFA